MDICQMDGDVRHLIVVGNGFDLYHHLDTDYSNYKQWLKLNDPWLLREFKSFPYLCLCGDDAPWGDLESALQLFWDDLCSEALENTYPNMMDDNPGWDDFGAELESELQFLKAFTRVRFCEWVKSIDVGSARRMLRLPSNAAYVTFNYTPTLECVYGVDPSLILHIHGSVLNEGAPLQFGSPENDPQTVMAQLRRRYEPDEFYGATIESGLNVVGGGCANVWKNICGNYEELESFLGRFERIETVSVMGNRCDKVDAPYYLDVIGPSLRDAEWVFFERDTANWDKMRDAGERAERFCGWLGIERYRVTKYRDLAL